MAAPVQVQPCLCPGPLARGAVAIVLALSGAACVPVAVAHGERDRADGRPPAFLGAVTKTCYDGTSDDLLTAGLGKSGLALAAPAFKDPAAPTPAELRRNAIHTNYRAILDIAASGGYGTLYGPNVDKDGNVTASEGRIAGCEYVAYADDGSGRKNVTLMVQIPDAFDRARPCIVTATSSGSRGIYGAIGASGEWGLKRGCAVAYTDKGTGNGLHDLMTDTVGLIDGRRTTAAAAGRASHFTADVSAAERQAFNANWPDRVAYKHAHSQQNPERDWGRNTLQSIVFAFHVLNEQFGNEDRRGHDGRARFDRRNTIVIASGVSNGGGAAIAAAEQDEDGLIDGVAVTEPNVQPKDAERIAIRQGATTFPVVGRPLYDYFTFANLYQPCAALSKRAAGSPAAGFLATTLSTNRCTALAAKGLVNGATTAEQAEDALDRLRGYGWLADSDVLQLSHYRFATNSIVVTYANTYGRFSVLDNVCGFSFANTSPTTFGVVPQSAALQAGLFSTGNGVPPTTGVNVVFNDGLAGATLDLVGVSKSSGLADLALDGALCHRGLATGRDAVTGARLAGAAADASRRVRRGIEEVLLDGRLRVPTLIAQGRADTLLPINHTGRAYYAVTQSRGPAREQVRLIEVTNAQHFDAFIGSAAFAGYDTRLVPLHLYLVRALDAMYDHLANGKALPPSQVVRTTPRGGEPGKAPAITAANVPNFVADPAAGDRITFDRGKRTLVVPD
jgi:hydroxybutyrate-dimer hydrolase